MNTEISIDYSTIALTMQVASKLGFEVIHWNHLIAHPVLDFQLYDQGGLFKTNVEQMLQAYQKFKNAEFPQHYLDKLK